MTAIDRYRIEDNEVYPSESGQWCKWSDIETLQKELDSIRAQALAAVWLLPEGTSIAELRELRYEAARVLMGVDKRTIADLQDALENAQEAYRLAVRPPVAGVNAVRGFKSDNRHVGYALMITGVTHASNGGLEIEVALP